MGELGLSFFSLYRERLPNVSQRSVVCIRLQIYKKNQVYFFFLFILLLREVVNLYFLCKEMPSMFINIGMTILPAFEF